MNDHRNPHGASPALIKEQELEDNLIKAEFAWNDAKTLDEKKKALELVNSALVEIEKFHNEKVAKKPNEMGYSESEASKYVGILGNSVREVREILDLDVEWDSQSWEEQRG